MGRSRESVIMQWWLPRIGGILALLTALFFGAYINQRTSPLIKFSELLLVSCGLCALGRWLEKRRNGVGVVLLVTGLIMIYLSSAAAYLLPAVKVIDSPLVGAIVQALALAVIVSVGLKRRSEGIVLLAYHFGFILCLFMAWEGLREGALLAALLLFYSGAAISRGSGFHRLPWVIVPAIFLLLPAVAAIGVLHPLELPRDLSVLVFLHASILIVPFIYYTGQWAEVAARRMLIAVATTGAIAGCFIYFRVFSAEALETGSLSLGLHFLLWAVIGWRRERYGPITQLFLLKGSFLLSAWVVLAYAGDLRWMVLALQTLLLAFSARHARRLAVELAVFAVGLASLFFLVTGGSAMPAVWSFHWWIVILYPAVLLLAGLVLLPGTEEVKRFDPRRVLYLAIPLIAVALWFQFFDQTPARPFAVAEAFTVVLFATAALGLVPWLSRFLAAAASGIAFVLTCVVFWSAPYSLFVIAGILFWAAVALYLLGGIHRRASEGAEALIHLFAIPALTLWLLFQLEGWEGRNAAIFVLSVALLLIGRSNRLRHLSAFSVLPPMVFLVATDPGVSVAWLVGATLLGLGWLFVPAVHPAVNRDLGTARRRLLWFAGASVLVWLSFLLGRGEDFGWFRSQWISLALAGVLLVGSGYLRNPGIFLGGVLFYGMAFGLHTFTLLRSENDLGLMPWGWEALASMALLVLVGGGWYLFAPKPWEADDPRRGQYQRAVGVLGGTGIFVLSLVTFQYGPLSWYAYYTPLLAATSFALIITGLLRRDPPLRFVGLASLIIPLGRLFLYDVQDALYRIIAFGAAAVLLTLLGYLYHVLSKRVDQGITPEGEEVAPETGPS
ncbi:MAG: hypothetical protein ACLFU2_07415 [Opitutales bacterium]